MKILSRLCALVLCLGILLSMLTTNTFAAEPEPKNTACGFSSFSHLKNVISMAKADPETHYQGYYTGDIPLVIYDLYIPKNLLVSANPDTEVYFDTFSTITIDGEFYGGIVYVDGNVIVNNSAKFGYMTSLHVNGKLMVNGMLYCVDSEVTTLNYTIEKEENITFGPSYSRSAYSHTRNENKLRELIDAANNNPVWQFEINADGFDINNAITIPNNVYLVIDEKSTFYNNLNNNGSIFISDKVTMLGRVVNFGVIMIAADEGGKLSFGSSSHYKDRNNSRFGITMIRFLGTSLPSDTITGIDIYGFQDCRYYDADPYTTCMMTHYGTEEHQLTPVLRSGIKPTCTQNGLTESAYCEVCGAVVWAPEELPAKGHTSVTDAAVAATCTAAGKTEGSHCSVCNAILKAQETIPAKGHTAVVDPAVAPTEYDMGLTEGSHCSVCGTVIKAQEVIPALGHTHTPITDAAVVPTCTAPGKTAGTHCSACGEIILAQQEIPASHSYSHEYDYKCNVCITDDINRNLLVVLHYAPDGSLSETIFPYIFCEGSQWYASFVLTSFSDFVMTQIGEEPDSHGHTPEADHAVAPTCTDAGLTEGSHCSTCGAVLKAQEEIPAAHTYSHEYDYKCDLYDYKCDLCGATRDVDMTRPMVDMFRMYNPNTGEHFYTGSTEERDNLIGYGWQYEGVGFTFPLTTGDPVHRLFQPSTGEHLYTMSVEEKDRLLAEGWNYEGIAFNSGFENEVPQYRLHNPNATVGAYHFTASKEEMENLTAAGWEYQGIGWYSLGAMP